MGKTSREEVGDDAGGFETGEVGTGGEAAGGAETGGCVFSAGIVTVRFSS